MTFSPVRIPISNVTQANPGVVTTSANHNLTTGQVVRVNVPSGWGMVELNKTLSIITVLSPTTFSMQKSQTPPFAINIDTSHFAAFTTPSTPQMTAEILPVGAGPTPVRNTPGQILNNECQDLLEDEFYNNSTSPIPY